VKINYDEYFSNKTINQFIKAIRGYADKASKELGINFAAEEDVEIAIEQKNILEQRIRQIFVEDYIPKNKIFVPVWSAIENMDPEALNSVANGISLEGYLDALVSILFFNTMLRDHEKVKFLISKTVMSECNHLKTEALKFLLDSFENDDDKEKDEELALLLTQNNNLAHNAYLKAMHNLCHDGMSNNVLIAGIENLPDLNIQITRKYLNDMGQTQQLQVSLLSSALQHKRLDLAKWLISKGAHLLPEEVGGLLRRVSDELLIESLKNLPNVNIQITEKYYENVEQERQVSLLSHVLRNHRTELTKWLVSKGANLLPEEANANTVMFEHNYYKKNDIYELLTWRNNFKSSMVINCKSLINWLNNGELHFANNLLKAYNKIPCFTKIIALKSDATKTLQNKYGTEIIEENKGLLDSLPQTLSNYFIENWNKSLLICKGGEFGSLFAISDLKRYIGSLLLDAFFNEELNVAENTGLVTELPDDFA
jgi:hypothetical protein